MQRPCGRKEHGTCGQCTEGPGRAEAWRASTSIGWDEAREWSRLRVWVLKESYETTGVFKQRKQSASMKRTERGEVRSSGCRKTSSSVVRWWLRRWWELNGNERRLGGEVNRRWGWRRWGEWRVKGTTDAAWFLLCLDEYTEVPTLEWRAPKELESSTLYLKHWMGILSWCLDLCVWHSG